ncbi:MAG: type II toxin-antitoxin system VapC family toxin [Bacteroidetes bacterium]|nr:type II toxin-antitoxin system VapC family toxin [Bacteroidota bacterium]MBI3482135.1 type II toxin-antitoxin system VapC family toxin [Bacteroidota bacterium]
MNSKLILDTNIVIYALQGDKHISDLIDEERLSISFITEIELLSWPQLSELDSKLIRNFIGKCRVIEYSSALKEKVIDVRKKYNLKMSDAFVAASAILDDSPLISADSVFSKIKELQFFQVKPNKK